MRAPRLSSLDDVLTCVLFLGALALPTLVGIAGEGEDVSDDEARVLAPAPVWPGWSVAEGPTALLERFPPEFDAWMDDHFGLRGFLLPRYHRVRFDLFRISPTEEVIVGDDGFFYLAEGTREFAPLGEEALAAWERELELRQAFLDELGIPYLFVVVPGKSDAYPEHLPADLARAKGRASRIDLFAEAMSARTDTRILNLAPVIHAAKVEGDLYLRNDPHWNARGAYIGYEAMVDALQVHFPELAPIPFESFGIRRRRINGGGLARMMGLGAHLTERSWKLRKGDFEDRSTRTDLTTGPQASFSTTRAGRPLTVLMFRDSYATALTPYLSETFGRIVFLWQRPTFAHFRAAVLRERPDVVIEERVARFLALETKRLSDSSPQETGD